MFQTLLSGDLLPRPSQPDQDDEVQGSQEHQDGPDLRAEQFDAGFRINDISIDFQDEADHTEAHQIKTDHQQVRHGFL